MCGNVGNKNMPLVFFSTYNMRSPRERPLVYMPLIILMLPAR